VLLVAYTMQNANGGLSISGRFLLISADFCCLQDRLALSMRYPSVHEGLVVDRTGVSTVGTIRVGFTIKFPCRPSAAGCSTLWQSPRLANSEQVHCTLQSACKCCCNIMTCIGLHTGTICACSILCIHRVLTEALHRPCTGLLVFITVKLNPVYSLHVSDNVKR
jgi:hypothetical protein